MYHVANSKMDQVTNSAMGKNIMEYMSIFREMGILKLGINCHSQWVAMLSAPEWMKIVVGIRRDPWRRDFVPAGRHAEYRKNIH